MKTAVIKITGKEDVVDNLIEQINTCELDQMWYRTLPFPNNSSQNPISWEGVQSLVKKKGSGGQLTEEELNSVRNYLKTKVRHNQEIFFTEEIRKMAEENRDKAYLLLNDISEAAEYLLRDDVPEEWEEFTEKVSDQIFKGE